MDTTITELFPDVTLTCVTTQKFKTACVSISFLTRLDSETASRNALIPRVLRRGTVSYPDMESISARLDELYGAIIEPTVRKKGEIQCAGLYALFPEDKYLPGDTNNLRDVTALMGEMLFSPAAPGANAAEGTFRADYVEGEKSKQLEALRSRVNDKRAYSIQRLRELMCFAEDYAIDRIGDEDSTADITPGTLKAQYDALLTSAPVAVFYCGADAPDAVARALAAALSPLPRGEREHELYTDVRLNSVEAAPRYFTEALDVTQGKLAIGFRLGDAAGDGSDGSDAAEYSDYVARLKVFNAAYGGSVTSKLFENVREKLSLCYFASSLIDRHKGVLFVSSGIEFQNYERARDEILAQLDAIKNGDLTDDELLAAKKCVASELRAAEDSQSALEDYFLAAIIDGPDDSPAELAARAETVTKKAVVDIANSLECDCVYFLTGTEGEAE